MIVAFLLLAGVVVGWVFIALLYAFSAGWALRGLLARTLKKLDEESKRNE